MIKLTLKNTGEIIYINPFCFQWIMGTAENGTLISIPDEEIYVRESITQVIDAIKGFRP